MFLGSSSRNVKDGVRFDISICNVGHVVPVPEESPLGGARPCVRSGPQEPRLSHYTYGKLLWEQVYLMDTSTAYTKGALRLVVRPVSFFGVNGVKTFINYVQHNGYLLVCDPYSLQWSYLSLKLFCWCVIIIFNQHNECYW